MYPVLILFDYMYTKKGIYNMYRIIDNRVSI